MVSLDKSSIDSKMLSWLRFPLAAMIVFIHTGYPADDKSQPAFYIGKLLSDGIASIAVPTFFFISGYLFFAKYNKFGFDEYVGAMKRKFFSLAVPYFLWIALVYYGYGFYSGTVTSINISPSELYKIFWASSDGYVANALFGYEFSLLSTPTAVGVLWFIRDLMIAMLLSPFIWWIIKHCRMWSITLFLIPYFLYIAIPIKGFGHAALCFFPLGATLSICGKKISDVTIRFGKIFIIAFAILLFVKYIMSINFITIPTLLGQLAVLSGIGAVLFVSLHSLKFSKSAEFITILGEASFLIYVGHTLPIFYLLNPITDAMSNTLWGGVVAYFFSWGIRLFFTVAGYFLMKKICPLPLSILVGGRLKTA